MSSYVKKKTTIFDPICIVTEKVRHKSEQKTSRDHISGQTGVTIQKVCLHKQGHTCTFEYGTWLNNVGQLKDCKNINSYQDQKSCQDNLEPLLMVQRVELYWLKSNLFIV